MIQLSPKNSTAVQAWFGTRFNDLDPLLRALHLQGGELEGMVEIGMPPGIAGVFGRVLARKLGVPKEAGQHHLKVSIRHDAEGLHWDRCFDRVSDMRSLFRPVGNLPDGYWLEDTGPVQLRLTVDVLKGGWYWRCIEVRFAGLKLPRWLFPQTEAFKTIEEGRYRFYVGISLPLLGTVLSYGGLLSPVLSSA